MNMSVAEMKKKKLFMTEIPVVRQKKNPTVFPLHSY